MHKTQMTLVFKKFKRMSESDGREGDVQSRRFGAFLSHYKAECGTEARLICEQLKHLTPDFEMFLDSDDLFDLRALLG